MATLLQALRTHGPKLVYNRTATTAELAEWLSGRTGLTRGQVLLVLCELHDAIRAHAASGTPVMLEGIGRVRPTIRQDGAMRLHLVPDRKLTRALGNLDNYHGEIANRANIGIGRADFKILWDEIHPEDPLELPAERAQSAEQAADSGGRGSRSVKRALRRKSREATSSPVARGQLDG